MTEVVSIASPDDRIDVAYSLRQRRFARLRCVKGHDMHRRHSFHIGEWMHCSRCGLIEDVPA